MRRIKLWAAAAVFGLSFLGQAFGQTTGDEVVVVVKQTDLKHNATVVETTYRGNYLTVRDVDGNWLWVDAETGNFDLAISTQQQAVDGATTEAKTDSLARLDLYKSGQPYRDVPKTDVATTTAAK